MRILLAVCLMASLCAALRAEPLAEPERAVIVTLKWEESQIDVDKVDRKEIIIPVQRGFGQLQPLFYELLSPDGDVYFCGGLVDPLSVPHSDKRLTTANVTLILPDLAEAKHLVIYRRISLDPKTGRLKLKEADL